MNTLRSILAAALGLIARGAAWLADRARPPAATPAPGQPDHDIGPMPPTPEAPQGGGGNGPPPTK